MSEMALSQRV